MKIIYLPAESKKQFLGGSNHPWWTKAPYVETSGHKEFPYEVTLGKAQLKALKGGMFDPSKILDLRAFVEGMLLVNNQK